MLFGEKCNLLRSLIVLTKEIDGLAPGGLLTTVEFAEIQDVPLKDATVVEAAVFDHAPVEVFLAIFESF
jgi:hypothetical protein